MTSASYALTLAYGPLRPNPVTEPIHEAGVRCSQSPRIRSRAAPRRRGGTSRSARLHPSAISRARPASPWGVQVEHHRLLASADQRVRPMPAGAVGCLPAARPSTTSAPKSARVWLAWAPAGVLDRSSTRSPARGPRSVVSTLGSCSVTPAPRRVELTKSILILYGRRLSPGQRSSTGPTQLDALDRMKGLLRQGGHRLLPQGAPESPTWSSL